MGSGGPARGPARGPAQLLQLYHQIDGLTALGWRAPRCRRWQAETLNCLRTTLGFHPAVVQFQGLRFRAGPVTATPEDLAGIADERHDERLRADLTEARRLLRSALAGLGVDADAPAPAVAGGAAADPPAGTTTTAPPPALATTPPPATTPADPRAIVAAARTDAALTADQRAAVERAAERLQSALDARPLVWEAVAAPLRLLLGYGAAVGRTAVGYVAARLPVPR